jgi:tetratricopeptide (TPR) repeat protein
MHAARGDLPFRQTIAGRCGPDMTPSPPSSTLVRQQVLLEALLGAHRAGRLDELLAQRPRLVRALSRRWLQAVLGTAGDALPAAHRDAVAVTLLLRWALSQLRPDQAATLADIERSAWLDRTSWRPMLALMCHFGFEPVPAFRDRYHARADEAAADVLCGLWSVGPSTFYRYLDKGRRQLAELLQQPPSGARALALRRLVQQHVDAQRPFADEAARREWHRQQAARSAAAADPVSALWHAQQARDAAGFVQQLQRATVVLAADAQTDLLCELLVDEVSLGPRDAFDLALAQAALWRFRQSAERESQCYERALRIAAASSDALMLGIVYGALGKFHEPRDADRAFACYEDSAEHLRRAAPPAGSTAADEAATAYASTLVRLAWLYVLRNDPRSRTVLDRAQQLRVERELPPEVLAMLEQAWGEYWRRAGELRRALGHKHRALNLYERLGDERSVLATYTNLGPIYGQLREFDRAIDYAQRVIAAAERLSIEPEILCSVHLNLGATYFWQGRFDDAIRQYTLGLEGAQRARLPLHQRRAHYNLAEAHYKKFQITQQPEHERLGDAHTAAALALAEREGDAARSDATRKLKAEVLGSDSGANPDRLLPQEFAAHFDEMAEVQRQRAVLAIPIEPQSHVRAHLAIARAYLAVAAKEREAALALIQRHGLDARFGDAFAQLREAFERELTREERLAAQWRQHAGDLLGEERRAAVLAELLRHGSIAKSGYAQACGLGPATASKHLGALAERGLLVQSGKGPSTRYHLPAAA